MGPVTAEVTIDVPRERVFAVVSDLALRPSFCDHFQEEYRLQRLASTGVGAAARFRVRAPRFPIWMETAISEQRAPHLLVESGRGARSDRMPIGTAWELSEGPGDTTEVRVSFWTEPGHPLDRVRERLGATGWYERRWRRALARLRELLEADAPLVPVEVAGASRP